MASYRPDHVAGLAATDLHSGASDVTTRRACVGGERSQRIRTSTPPVFAVRTTSLAMVEWSNGKSVPPPAVTRCTATSRPAETRVAGSWRVQPERIPAFRQPHCRRPSSSYEVIREKVEFSVPTSTPPRRIGPITADIVLDASTVGHVRLAVDGGARSRGRRRSPRAELERAGENRLRRYADVSRLAYATGNDRYMDTHTRR